MRIISILLLLFVIACKNKQESSSTTSKPNPQIEAMRGMEDVEEDENAEVMEKTVIDLPENAVARIQRTPCFGRCPIYTLTVFADGSVIYHAEKWVEKEGDFQAQADPAKFQNLLARAKEIGYFDFNNEYDSESVTDLPSTITTLRNGDQLKQVINRYQGPESLSEFENYFDSQYLKLDWKIIE